MIRLRVLTTLLVVAVAAAAFGIYDHEDLGQLNHLAGQERKTFNQLGRALTQNTRGPITAQDVQKAKHAFARHKCRLHGTTLRDLEQEAATPRGILC